MTRSHVEAAVGFREEVDACTLIGSAPPTHVNSEPGGCQQAREQSSPEQVIERRQQQLKNPATAMDDQCTAGQRAGSARRAITADIARNRRLRMFARRSG